MFVHAGVCGHAPMSFLRPNLIVAFLDSGTDRDVDTRGVESVAALKNPNHSRNDSLDNTPPAGMRDAHDTGPLVVEKDRETVGAEDCKECVRLIGNQRISARNETPPRNLLDDGNARTMHLPRENDLGWLNTSRTKESYAIRHSFSLSRIIREPHRSIAFRGSCKENGHRRISVMPWRNGCNASGMRTEPSSCWWFSRMAMRVRPMAKPVPFKRCGNSTRPSVRCTLVLRRRAWKSVVFEVEVTSRYSHCLPFSPGSHASISNFAAAGSPRSPAHILSTRYGMLSAWKKRSSSASRSRCSSGEVSGMTNVNISTLSNWWTRTMPRVSLP